MASVCLPVAVTASGMLQGLRGQGSQRRGTLKRMAMHLRWYRVGDRLIVKPPAAGVMSHGQAGRTIVSPVGVDSEASQIVKTHKSVKTHRPSVLPVAVGHGKTTVHRPLRHPGTPSLLCHCQRGRSNVSWHDGRWFQVNWRPRWKFGMRDDRACPAHHGH